MSVSIKATCLDCGTSVELSPDLICLEIDGQRRRARYGFMCPQCDTYKHRVADDHVVNLLLGGGVIAQPWVIPPEMLEPHHGPALTEDDLIEFGRALESM